MVIYGIINMNFIFKIYIKSRGCIMLCGQKLIIPMREYEEDNLFGRIFFISKIFYSWHISRVFYF